MTVKSLDLGVCQAAVRIKGRVRVHGPLVTAEIGRVGRQSWATPPPPPPSPQAAEAEAEAEAAEAAERAPPPPPKSIRWTMAMAGWGGLRWRVTGRGASANARQWQGFGVKPNAVEHTSQSSCGQIGDHSPLAVDPQTHASGPPSGRANHRLAPACAAPIARWPPPPGACQTACRPAIFTRRPHPADRGPPPPRATNKPVSSARDDPNVPALPPRGLASYRPTACRVRPCPPGRTSDVNLIVRRRWQALLFLAWCPSPLSRPSRRLSAPPRWPAAG